MLKSLEIKNFQIYKEAKFDFVDGINILVGSSHQGKSSVIRALKWLLRNRPLGSGFVRIGTKDCLVKGIFSEGNEISRSKNKSENCYYVNGEKLDTVGSDVPEKVNQIINISDDSIQSPGDPFFLLQDTPGKVAQHLNKVFNLEDIDKCLKEADSTVNQYNRELKNLEDQEENLKSSLEKYKDIPEREEKVAALERIKEELDSIYDKQARLDKYIAKIQEKRKQLEKYKDLEKIKSECEQIQEKADQLKSIKKRSNRLKVFVDELRQQQEALDDLKEFLEVEAECQRLEGLSKDLEETNSKLEKIKRKVSSYHQASSRIADAQKRRKQKEKEEDKLKKKLKACPLCGKPF